MDHSSETGVTSLDGQFLIAMPGMDDPRFERTVVYMCAHSTDGAMGIVINRIAGGLTFRDLLAKLDVIESVEDRTLPASVDSIQVHFGGPVETGRGFVIHSSDFFIESATLPIAEGVAMTTTVDILRAIASGVGPRQAFLALGYAGWGPGQLETEIQANGWLTVPADREILFSGDTEAIYASALGRLGVDVSMLSASAGHA